MLTLLAGWAGFATGAPPILGDVEGSYELSLDHVRMPLNESDGVTLRTCDACESKRHRVDGNTRYFVNGAALPFADFIALVQSMRGSASANSYVIIGVFYDLESTVTTRIVLHDHRE
jgi:hypothetical protein